MPPQPISAGRLGPFTVFAPTDEAFAKIPKADLDALLKDKAELTQVLTYHVVSGKVMAADVMKLKEAKTVAGPMVKIDTSYGVKVNNAAGQGRRHGLERRHPRDRHGPAPEVARRADHASGRRRRSIWSSARTRSFARWRRSTRATTPGGSSSTTSWRRGSR